MNESLWLQVHDLYVDLIAQDSNCLIIVCFKAYKLNVIK